MKKVNWAFLGAAGIARKNWGSVLRSGNGVLKTVASRKKQSADSFIALCQKTTPHPTPSTAVEGYQAALDDPEIDAVYLPLPTGLRSEWIERAARAGKHILSEKPVASSAAELERLLAICEENNVQFMDGVMMTHGTRFAEIRHLVREGNTLGEIRRIDSGFTFLADPDFSKNIRLDPALEPAGCLGDLGWYPIRFAQEILGLMPEKVRCHVTRWENGVPTEASAELLFADGLTAAFHCGFTSALQQWVRISGEKAVLSMDDFVQPKQGPQTFFLIQTLESKKDGGNFRMVSEIETRHVEEPAASDPDSQETKLFRTFNTLALSGTPDPAWPQAALRTQRILDALLHSARADSTWTSL